MFRTIFVCAALSFASSAALADIYVCSFNNRDTRGWVPEVVTLDTQTGIVDFYGETATVQTNETENLIWSKRVMSDSNRRIDIVYRLTIRANLRARLQVNMRQYSNEYVKNGTCVTEH